MNNIVITLLKWLFLAIGLGLLAIATRVESSAAILLIFLGVVFASIGGGIIGYGWWSKKSQAHLREHGHLIQADFQRVERNESLEVNGANPFRIIAQWHDVKNNRLYIYKSTNLWFDPSQFIQGKKIPVYIELSNPSKYCVDTTFLPEVHG